MKQEQLKFLLKWGADEDLHSHVNLILNHPETDSYLMRHVARIVGTKKNLKPEVFETLTTHPKARQNYNVREVMSQHPETPQHVIHAMVNDDRYTEQLLSIAHRPDTKPEHLEQIAKEGISNESNEQAGRAALENPKMPVHVLDEFSHHPDPYVAVAVAFNPNSTKEHLHRIINRHEFTAGGEVARNQLKKRFRE